MTVRKRKEVCVLRWGACRFKFNVLAILPWACGSDSILFISLWITNCENSSGLKQYPTTSIFSPSFVELQHSGPRPTSDTVVTNELPLVSLLAGLLELPSHICVICFCNTQATNYVVHDLQSLSSFCQGGAAAGASVNVPRMFGGGGRKSGMYV